MPIDYKKIEKDLYQPKVSPSIVNVPVMVFIAVELLYGFSYAIKMGNKAILDYVVPPLEGFWTGDPTVDKSTFEWTALIRQPDFVTDDVFSSAKAALAKKRPGLDTLKAQRVAITEGLCVQAMHIGSYDDEPATVTPMERFAVDNGIYLSDPRKVAPSKLKTIIRHPVRKVG